MGSGRRAADVSKRPRLLLLRRSQPVDGGVENSVTVKQHGRQQSEDLGRELRPSRDEIFERVGWDGMVAGEGRQIELLVSGGKCGADRVGTVTISAIGCPSCERRSAGARSGAGLDRDRRLDDEGGGGSASPSTASSWAAS